MKQIQPIPIRYRSLSLDPLVPSLSKDTSNYAHMFRQAQHERGNFNIWKRIGISFILLLLFLQSFNLMHAVNLPYKAVVIVPVADLVGKPLFPLHIDGYDLPISGVEKYGCARIHQLIFNEIVTVHEEQGNEVRISIPNIFFEQAQNSQRCTEYWTHKHALASLTDLKEHHIPLTLFPDPISFSKYEKETVVAKSENNISTLLFPCYDPITDVIYSAGTRFIKAGNVQAKTVPVYAYSHKKHKIFKISLPKNICLLQEPQTAQEKVVLFTNIVQQWAQLQQGYIPYVLGGCSFTTNCMSDNFVKKGTAYYRPTYAQTSIPGLDCTGLIARAAQICGIPYFFKNTTTLVKYLRPLAPHESIENGDIIWINGHAIIIADIKKDLCVEARSYDHGFGKVHALPIYKLFADIKHVDDIKTAMFEKKQVVRLDCSGKSIQTMPSIKILKLASVWERKA